MAIDNVGSADAVLSCGTGIGGGLILDGRLRMGAVVAAVRECFGSRAANVVGMLHPEMVEIGGSLLPARRRGVI